MRACRRNSRQKFFGEFDESSIRRNLPAADGPRLFWPQIKIFWSKNAKILSFNEKTHFAFFYFTWNCRKKNFGPLLLKQIVLPFLLCNKELQKQFKEFFLQKNVFVLVDFICFSSQFCLFRLDQIKRHGGPFLFALDDFSLISPLKSQFANK